MNPRRILLLALMLLISGRALAAPNPAVVAACFQMAQVKPVNRMFHWWGLEERADRLCPQGEVASPACLKAISDERFYRATLDAVGPLKPRAQALERCEALKKEAR